MTTYSPCTGYCRLENGKCIGCGRTEKDIENWLDMSYDEQVERTKQIRNDP